MIGIHEVRASRIGGWLYNALEWRPGWRPTARNGRYDSKTSQILRYQEVLRLDVVGAAGVTPSAYGWQCEDPLDLRWRCDPVPGGPPVEVAHKGETGAGDFIRVRRHAAVEDLGDAADGRAIRRAA